MARFTVKARKNREIVVCVCKKCGHEQNHMIYGINREPYNLNWRCFKCDAKDRINPPKVV